MFLSILIGASRSSCSFIGAVSEMLWKTHLVLFTLFIAPHGYAFYICLRFDLNENSVSVRCGWHRTAYAVCIQRILSKMALRWRRGDKLLNKVIIFVFYVYKKYSRSFIKLRFWTTDGRWTIWRCLSYFSGPWQCNLLGSQWDSHKPPGFHPKYLKLCSEDDQSFYGYGTTLGVSD